MSTESLQKRVLDSSRHYSGQEDAEPVVEWLNRNRDARAAKRVGSLIATLRGVSGGGYYRGLLRGEPNLWAARVARDMRQTLSALRRYRYSPYVYEDSSGPVARVCRVVMVPSQWPGAKRGRVVEHWERHGTNQESWGVLHIIRLAQDGLLDKVRCCPCGVWFFAHARSMRWCSVRCRHADYKSTPEWKVKRNKYARDYYRKNLSASRLDKSQRKAGSA